MELTRFFSAYRIAHRLPGRIRINIPILTTLPAKWRTFLDPAAELIKVKNGITTAEIRPATGSLLITYNLDQIDEAQILAWLEALVDDFINLGAPLGLPDEADVRDRFRELRNRLSQESVV